MSVEFIGYVSAREQTEVLGPYGAAIDPAYIASSALLQERGGFDRVLVAFHSNSPDSLIIAQHVIGATRNLGVLVAHRPGFATPTLAARQFATLDQISGGRVAVHIITGGNDRELEADGDHLTKTQRYARAAEYVGILRQEWQAQTPFDHTGAYYRIRGAYSDVKPFTPQGIPVYFGGASPEALAVTGQYADGYALWGEPLQQAAELVARVRVAAHEHGRKVRFSVSFRPIVAHTEQAAWERAADIEATLKARQKQAATPLDAAAASLDVAGQQLTQATLPTNEGSRRLQAIAAKGARHDARLWTGVAQATGGRWNSTALVGTSDQVAESLLHYYRLGIETFLIRGFDPVSDALIYGRELIPRVRALIAQEEPCCGAA